MSYKISLILSFIFVIMFFTFGVDLMSIQYIYADLDTKSTAISYQIAKRGTVEPEFIKSLENKYSLRFLCLSNCTPKFGDILEYKVSKIYSPMIVSNSDMEISLIRSTVIGYYN